MLVRSEDSGDVPVSSEHLAHFNWHFKHMCHMIVLQDYTAASQGQSVGLYVALSGGLCRRTCFCRS